MNWLVHFVPEFKLIELIRKLCKIWIKLFYIVRDPNFTLSEFIKSLKLELKTWRKVFWRLWGICHVSNCSLCEKPFQVKLWWNTEKFNLRMHFFLQFYMLEFCSFHPGEAEFPNIQFKNSTLPMGEYPCCGQLALRFQPLFQVRGWYKCQYWPRNYISISVSKWLQSQGSQTES